MERSISKNTSHGDNKRSQSAQGEPTCPDCRNVRLKHPLFGNRDRGIGRGELYQFTTSEKCKFCFLISHAFMRSVEGQIGRERFIEHILRGWQHYLMQAMFSFPAGFGDSQNVNVSGDLAPKDGSYLKAFFHENTVGDMSGDAPISAAFFRIGCKQMPRSLRSSRKNRRYRRPKSFSTRRQKVGQAVNWISINGWLQACRENHSDRCQCTARPISLNRPARVIDVQADCVVKTPACEYLTLSYVWGQKKNSNPLRTAVKSNINFLQKPGALSHLGLSNTILDAMYACAKLGHRYLWVDSLCIVQDDEDDVKEQIACMSDIYSEAFLTIIAAWGEHSDSGLPGVVWGPPRTPQLITNFDGVELIEVLPLIDDVLRNSRWRTRAWTQQEWLLSNRRLYFTNVQVYFECKTELHNEDPWVMKAENDNKTPRESESEGRLKFIEPESPDRWARLRYLLEDYTERDLSFSDDVFNACTGIYQSVYGSNTGRFLFGLPELNFVEALRWDALAYERTKRIPQRIDFVLPSWSWASSIQRIDWMRGDGYTFRSTSDEGPSFCNLVSFKVCLDQRQGYTQVVQSDLNHNNPLPIIANKRYPQPIGTHNPVPGRLLFRTQSNFFELMGDFGYLSGREDHSLNIVNQDGARYSEIDVPLQWALSNVEKNYYNAKGRQFQFIAISAACIPSHWTISHLDDYVSKRDASVVDEVNKYFDYCNKIDSYEEDGKTAWFSFPESRKHLHVMLIEKHGNACRRIGITSMSLAGWLQSNPKLEDIVLE